MNVEAPCTIETTAITALTAMMMPSCVSELRTGLGRSSAGAILMFSTTRVVIVRWRSWRAPGRRARRRDALVRLRRLLLGRAHRVALLERVEHAVGAEDDEVLLRDA